MPCVGVKDMVEVVMVRKEVMVEEVCGDELVIWAILVELVHSRESCSQQGHALLW
jgi:hypothetical protein